MARLDGSWLCKLEGHPDVSTDDLTLDELEIAERSCGVPYVLMDPHASVRVAKALFAVMLMRAKLDAGTPQRQAEDEAVKAAGKLTTKRLHGAFAWVPPSGPPLPPATDGEVAADPPASAPTSDAG